MSTIQGRLGGEVVGTTLRIPRQVRDELKIQAIRSGRSFNTHVAMILKDAAGDEIGVRSPAAGKAQCKNHSEASSHAAE